MLEFYEDPLKLTVNVIYSTIHCKKLILVYQIQILYIRKNVVYIMNVLSFIKCHDIIIAFIIFIFKCHHKNSTCKKRSIKCKTESRNNEWNCKKLKKGNFLVKYGGDIC